MSDSTPTDAPFTATLKAGAGYEAPWLVLRADNPAELEANLDVVTEGLLQKINDVAALFQGARAVSAPATEQPANVTPINQAQNGGGLKTCNHGVRTRRTGNGAKGAWVGYFCPLQKGDANQCKPIFEDA